MSSVLSLVAPIVSRVLTPSRPAPWVEAPVDVHAPVGIQAPVRVHAPVDIACLRCGDLPPVVAIPAVVFSALMLAHFPVTAIFGGAGAGAATWLSTKGGGDESRSPESEPQAALETAPSDFSAAVETGPNPSESPPNSAGDTSQEHSQSRPNAGRNQDQPSRTEPASVGVDDPELHLRLSAALREAGEKGPPRIAVMGKRGVGKSTWVNSIRGLKPNDPGAAKVGADEVVSDQQRAEEGAQYTYLGMTLQDIPGCEGSQVTQAMGDPYIKKFKLNTADACIFMYELVLEPRMLACALKLDKEHNVPVFLVRNKVGRDCRNEVDDGNAENNHEAFDNIKMTAYTQISKENEYRSRYANTAHVFLIESKYTDATREPPSEDFQKDFRRLKEALVHGIRDEARKAQVKHIFAKNVRELAKARAQLCKEMVPLIAAAAATSGAVPIPGVSEAGTLAIATGAVAIFSKQFCLTAELVGDVPMLREAAKYLAAHLAIRIPIMVAALLAADAGADAMIAIPVVGFLVSAAAGATFSYFGIKIFCKSVIPRLQKVAEKLYTMTVAREMELTDFQNFVHEIFYEEPEQPTH